MSFFSVPASYARAIAAAADDPRSRWSPGRSEAWWWLAVPVLAVIGIIAVFRIDEPFYRAWILPEGYGVLELSQFLLALGGCLIALRLLTTSTVKGWRLLLVAVAIFAGACFFIAGEEHSWGQHFFQWQTPEYWSEINRQQETNLHNSFRVLNHLPQLILEIGIATGGLLMPLYQWVAGPFRDPLLRLFAPANALVPAALAALLFKAAKRIGDSDPARDLVTRPSEAMELFFYLFIFFYMVVLARRVRALGRHLSSEE
ncbi:MAG: hypothetical protein ACT4N2_10290 [Hyphomicrobium sp.]